MRLLQLITALTEAYNQLPANERDSIKVVDANGKEINQVSDDSEEGLRLSTGSSITNTRIYKEALEIIASMNEDKGNPYSLARLALSQADRKV